MSFEKDLKQALSDYEQSLVDYYNELPDPKRRKKMKGKRNWYIAFASLAAVLVLFVGLRGILPGMKSSQSGDLEMMEISSEGAFDHPAEATEEMAVEEEAQGALEGALTSDQLPEDEKIIHTYNLTIETKDIKTSIEKLESLIKKQGGFIENAQQNGQMQVGENANAFYIFRIPREKSEALKGELEKLGQTQYFSQQQDNVTKSYRDTQARVDLLRTKEDRLMELLEIAKDLEDLIAIESQIMDLQFEREQMQAYLNDLDQQVAYDTYYLDLVQVKVFTEKSFTQKIKDSFTSGLEGFRNFLEGSLLFLIYNWAFILLFGLLILAFSLIFKAVRKKKNKER
ncbi:MAG TPA: DUF4349 domain-containing protein [Clostridia bacterium]|nr:DUF4349 domain-containing protein [Clostridia bacterium]